MEIVIACEGKNTEPDYFARCAKHYGAGMVRLRVLQETGVPLTVVRVAIDEYIKLRDLARRRPPSDRNSFRVFAVFDKDDHDVGEALKLAAEHRIDVAFSNPCFELWPLLHLEDYGAQDGRHAVQRRLKALMPKYDHANRAIVDFDQIKDLLETATLRARTLNSCRLEEGCEGGCPSTTVPNLVTKIVENGRVNHRMPRMRR